jgi:hypothetical protein
MALLVGAVAAFAAAGAQAQGSGQRQEGVEVLIAVRDEAPRCDPGELRLPADANVNLRIRNGGTKSVAFRAADLMKSDAVRGAKNAQPEAGDAGYVVSGGQTAEFVVKAPAAGQYAASCADPASSNEGQKITVSVAR